MPLRNLAKVAFVSYCDLVEGESIHPHIRNENCLRDVLVVYLGVLAAMFAVSPIGFSIPLLGSVSGIVTVVLFLYVPMLLARNRGEDIANYGFNTNRWPKSLLLAVVSMAIILPLFVLGHFALREFICDTKELAKQIPVMACGQQGWSFPELGNWREMPGRTQAFWEYAATQFGVVALTEEFFVRGTLLTLLEKRLPPKFRFLGGGLGLALVISCVLFGLIHWPLHGPGQALATMFPALWFGWLQSATGSIVAPVICHAMANIVQAILYAGFV